MVTGVHTCGTAGVDRRLAPTALAVALLTSGCGEMQPAEPLGKTVPVALVLFVASSAAVGALVRRTLRAIRADRRQSDLRWPLATAVALVAPVAVGGMLIVGLFSVSVAVGFREATVSIFTWRDLVVGTAIAGGITLTLTALACAIASGLASSGPTRMLAVGVLAALVVLGIVGAAGYGLVWLPALLLALVRDEAGGARRDAGIPELS